MKLLLATIGTIFLANSINAQGIALGIRTGIDAGTDITNVKENKPHALWQKQLFTRYETKKRLAFEIYANQSNNSENIPVPDIIWEYFYPFPQTHQTLDIQQKSNYLTFGGSVQYDISCSKLKESCPIFRNLKSYLGITANITRAWYKEITTIQNLSDGSISNEVYKSKYWADIQMGINHTTTYTFNRIFLTSTASFTVNPWMLNDPIPSFIDENNTRFSIMAGIGYKL